MVVVLVVSGEARIGRHIRSVLGSQGWWVTAASDREEALRASADREPGLVIVDCEVEGAAELVRTFGAKNGGPGVLLLEPPGEGDSAFHAFEAGADQILSKPPLAESLLEAAQRVMSLPHQSGGSVTADLGEKLGATEIFGDLLLELDETGAGPNAESSGDEPGPAKSALPEVPEPARKPASKVAEPPPTSPEPPSDESQAEPKRADVGEPVPKPEAADEKPEETEAGEPEAALETPATTTVSDADPASEGSSEMFDPRVLIEDLGRIEAPVPLEAVAEVQAEPERVDVGEPVPEPEAADEKLEETEASEPEAALETPATSTVSDADPAGEASSEIFDPKVLVEDLDRIEAPAPRVAAEEVKAEPETISPATISPPDDTDDSRFGQYRLEERVAVGGMAEVWRASMLGMEGFRKTVAIKKILPHLAENSEFVTMFIEEAKLAAQLSHENLVEIYDLGKIGESFFIAMEYVDGKDLRGLLNRFRQGSGSMPIGLALLVAGQVARGLEYAHTREDDDGNPLGLVHRDVSPRNVLIGSDGRVRLCDFGVAKAVSSVIQTQIGALKGKLQYMSPEQASGRQVDHRSDIYSLGSVMYEMISGRRLYDADNEISLLDAVRAGNFDDPRKHCPGLPQEVRRILVKALAKKPSARYQSAGALELDLRALLTTLEPAPNEQALSAFVRELYAEPMAQMAEMAPTAAIASSGSAAAEQSVTGEGATASAGTEALRAPGAVAEGRGWRALASGKVVRFWWGVAAGLLAAGLVAGLFKLFFG